ncbi:hypothetical protein ACFZDK_51985 [Streptomyces sp. NPDC007901]|uniref:hypothetical protein n=1 Tax=Streptomyces sp. NPDC007901 TaxID=3364785 RepID=UPI0036EB4515
MLLHPALTPAAVVTVALVVAAPGGTLARAEAARLGPEVVRDADLAVPDATAAVELVGYGYPGFEDQLGAAGIGAESVRDLVEDLQLGVRCKLLRLPQHLSPGRWVL